MTITLDDLASHAGRELAVSPWLDVPQSRIDQFAAATGDRQWIHTDPARAAVDSPFHATIAHGFLTLSLTSALMASALSISGTRMALNYGTNRVRFVSPVPAGSRIRGRFTLQRVDPVEDGAGVQATWQVTIEREGGTKPACVLEWMMRYYRA
jgi:acyl dehydratase